MNTRPPQVAYTNVRKAREARASIQHLLSRLTAEVTEIERDLAARSRLHRHELSAATSPYYRLRVSGIVQNLRNISAGLLISVRTNHVKAYPQAHEMPADFRSYFYAAQNLTNAVTEEIFSASTMDQARLCFERWVAVMKRAHETHDYFTANVICLALASETMLLSGLASTLTVTAKAVLEYLERQYCHSSFIYSLQTYHAQQGRAVIPMLTTISYMQERSGALSEDAKQIKNLLRAMKAHIRNDHIKPAADVIRLIKKEPSVSHQNRFTAYAIGWSEIKAWRYREMNLTMRSLKLFKPSDRYYIAKHTIEMSMHKLGNLDESCAALKLEAYTILREEHQSDEVKHKRLKQFYRLHREEMSGGLMHVMRCVLGAFHVIKHYHRKSARLEPIVIPKEEVMMEPLSSEESETGMNLQKTFSWMNREERALKRAVEAQAIPAKTLTPRKSFGLFRSATQPTTHVNAGDGSRHRLSKQADSLDE